MKYLVLGGNGMAGHVLALHLRENGHDVDVTARNTNLFADSIVLDVRDHERLDRIVAGGRYDVVVNCAGLLIEASELRPDEAVLINAHLPHRVAWILRDTSTRLVHLSTDCVFSGKDGPYAEDAEPDGHRAYDRSKALGEIVNDKDLTLRMSIIGPDWRPHRAGLFDWFMQQDRKLDGFTRAWWSGITTIELAQAVEQLSQDGVSGLMHLASSESITKYDLLVRLNETFDRGLSVQPVKRHSSDHRLKSNRADIRYRFGDYDQQLRAMRDWIDQHPDLYPHYGTGVA